MQADSCAPICTCSHSGKSTCHLGANDVTSISKICKLIAFSASIRFTSARGRHYDLPHAGLWFRIATRLSVRTEGARSSRLSGEAGTVVTLFLWAKTCSAVHTTGPSRALPFESGA